MALSMIASQYSSETSSNSSHATEQSRDEVKEVYKLAAQDTKRIRTWRLLLTIMLISTAVAVTCSTYRLLKHEQQQNFETAFYQFARTIADSSIDQQKNLVDASASFVDSIAAYAQTDGLEWPFVTMPFFEKSAEHILKQSKAEILAVFPMVARKEREAWEIYASKNAATWVREGHLIKSGNLDRFEAVGYHANISRKGPSGVISQEENDYYFPFWQYSPPPSTLGTTNIDILSTPDYKHIVEALFALHNQTLTTKVRGFSNVALDDHIKMHEMIEGSNVEHPHAFMFRAIHKNVISSNVKEGDSDIVGVMGYGFAWDAALQNLLPEGVNDIHAIIRNDCNQSYTYEVNGKRAFFLGDGDNHDAQYDSMEVVAELSLYSHPNFTTTSGHCQYSMHIYPTKNFENCYASRTPWLFAVVLAFTFASVTAVFLIYDLLVQRRNQRLVFNAARSNAIVSSIIPHKIRDRLFHQKEGAEVAGKQGKNLRSILHGDLSENGETPIAELFLETTVMFADVAGFTAWSSVREPSKVFLLLETLYCAFDVIAKKRRVFKVDSVGDSYVAVAGVPDPVKDHAVVMVLFARDLMEKMNSLVKRLEVTLGPDTGDLLLRIGMHSGPVTGGILRGDRCRFQLFGDTVNTAGRLESTGKQNYIQISQETATLVTNAGKGEWLRQRSDKIQTKGKGELVTYWAYPVRGSTQRSSEPSMSEDYMFNTKTATMRVSTNVNGAEISEKIARLVDWNVEVLLNLLKQVVANRNAISHSSRKQNLINRCDSEIIDKGEMPLDEVCEIIALPEFNGKAVRAQNIDDLDLPESVAIQLQDYVTQIATMYKDNPFHNFDHASHVVMSVIKLMSRIVAPSDVDLTADERGRRNSTFQQRAAAHLHDHTYGITSDPLTQFACAFSALIHDVDHQGVPNAQLVKEKVKIAEVYHNRSVAEQNSLDLSWDLIMTEKYSALRMALCSTDEELRRFRQLVVNSVMATDIVDGELKLLRNARWDTAFKKEHCVTNVAVSAQTARDNINRKATIVIEHLIQASDVAHTMQHWHIYRKWNEQFFEENYKAYRDGRSEKNPIDFWYKGEIGFFDFYIIPLAKKLKECGVFGISSDEYLNYALANRQEWEEKGEVIVAEMIKKYCGEVALV